MIHRGGHGKWRAQPRHGRSSPWFETEVGARCWLLVHGDRIRPLVEAGYAITGVTR